MLISRRTHSGFTIVELLIVIVVIGILAAITVVAYNGVQDRGKTSAVASALSQAAQKIAMWQVDNPGQYPVSAADAGVNDTDTIAYQYTSDTTPSYCLTATYDKISYYISNTNTTATQGVCAGYNLIAWNKTKAGAPLPVTSATADTSTYRTSTESMRLGPGLLDQQLRGTPYSGAVGQTYTVTLWLRTDSNWNGTSGNSKIRISTPSGSLLGACGYGGVKTSWTQVTCSFTLTSSAPSIKIGVGNDGTTGNIWIDDMSLTLT